MHNIAGIHGRWLVLAHDSASDEVIERRAFHARHHADEAYERLAAVYPGDRVTVGLVDAGTSWVVVRTTAASDDAFFGVAGYT